MDLIGQLEAVEDKNQVCSFGFCNPHSYRGYYSEVAFEPTENTTVQSMLDCAKDALGTTYLGWKGGEFTMDSTTYVYLAYEGHTGDPIGSLLIRYMLGERNLSPNMLR